MNEFIGVIVEVLDKDSYKVLVDVPGYGTKLPAFPFRGEVEEPRVNDVVWIHEFDPKYKSYYLYSKLKENKFIGIRARGKKIKIEDDSIQIGIFTDDEKWYDKNSEDGDSKSDDTSPECTSWIKIDKEGNLEINTKKDIKIVSEEGNVSLDVQTGTTDIKSKGNVNISGSGILNVKSLSNTEPGMFGPFNCLPNCILTGASHAGNKIKLSP